MDPLYRLLQRDLLGTVYDLEGTEFEVVYVTAPARKEEAINPRTTPEWGNIRATDGWRCRRHSTRSDRDRDRRAWLTPPASTPELAVESLQRRGYISPPASDS